MNPLEIPHLTRFVNDFSHIFSEDQKNTLDLLFSEHEKKTSEQIVTVFIPHREGNELLDIGLKLFNENGIGQKNLNNGLLLIISTEEKKLRIIVGKGLELKYTEMVCRDIVENQLRPLLNAGKYEEMVRRWGEIIVNRNQLLNKSHIVKTRGIKLGTFSYAQSIILVIFLLNPIIAIVIGLTFFAISFILLRDLFTGNIIFDGSIELILISLIIFSIIFIVIRFLKITKTKKHSILIFIALIFLIINFLQAFVFPLHCELSPTENIIYKNCSREIFGKEFTQQRVSGYTQSYKDSHPEQFQSSSTSNYKSSSSDYSSSHDFNSSDSSSSFDGGGGSSNGGGYGD